MNSPRPCDICGSQAKRRLYAQRFCGFDDGSALPGYDVVACSFCGFLFADGIPGQDAFDRYYRTMSKYESHDNGGAVSEATAGNHRDIAAEISALLPDRSIRILDVGCASGHLLWAFKQLGYHNLRGLDPSPLCSQIAFERYGVQVANNPISEMALAGESFDLILLSSVLEHVRDLLPAVGEITKLLAPEGSIWFEVPDASRFREFVESPFQQFSLEHINFFTLNSLEALLQKAGFLKTAAWTAQRWLGAIVDPALDALFLRADGTDSAVTQDEFGPPAMADYITRSEKVEDALYSIVRPLIERETPIVIWGAGSLALHLFAQPRFRALNARAFVDTNRNYHGKTIDGLPVLAPIQMRDRGEAILIVSRVYEAQIELAIRNEHGLANETFRLFDAAAAAR